MGRGNTKIILMVGLICLVLGFALPAYSGGRRPVQLQTVPTRTPTPGVPPSSTPDSGGGGQVNPTATPTGATPTGSGPTVIATAATQAVRQTPVGGYLPTAEPCAIPPTVRASARVNVREGPGMDYRPITILLLNEVRPIIGRAERSAWWLIELPDGSEGWVANRAVVVSGYTGLVPLVDAPKIDGSTPTPGARWRPTVDPMCTPPAEESAGPQAAGTAATRTPSPTKTPRPSASPTASRTVTPLVPQATPSGSDTEFTPAATTESSATQPSRGGGSNWLLFTGVGLVVAGGIFWLLRRRP